MTERRKTVGTALITGASSGLGEEFARQLARERYDLVLTARRDERLRTIADEAKSLGSGRVDVVALDLSIPGSAEALYRRITDKKVSVDYLVNNAGFGTRGRFANLPLDREVEQINLNVTALVGLARLFLPAMLERKGGTIINVASTAAFQPVPFMATYGATKAFVLSFSEALAEELRGTGVVVTALCPGPTRTEFQQVAGTAEVGMHSISFMDAKAVVAQAIDAAKRGKSVKITGLTNLLLAESIRLAPRSLAARIAGSMFRREED